MKIRPTKISYKKLIEPKVFDGNHCFFMEACNEKVFRDTGINTKFVTDNHSRSVKNTLRGHA